METYQDLDQENAQDFDLYAGAVAEEEAAFTGDPILDAPVPQSALDPYANIPADERSQFETWNSNPLANHDETLATLEDQRLAEVVRRAQEMTGYQFVAASGKRDRNLQAKAVEWGWSKTMNSDHIHGGAIDLWPLDDRGAVTFDNERQTEIAIAMKKAAAEKGYELDWGGEWKSFKDMPHFSIKGEMNHTDDHMQEAGKSDAEKNQFAWEKEAYGKNPLLDFIADGEGTGSNYNAHYGAGGQTSVQFTDMTINEVLQWQKDFVRQGSPSSAVGRYQFIQKTLKGVVGEMGLSLDEKFTPEIQDMLAMHQLKARGLDKWQRGGLTDEEFGNNLAQEWASLPMLSGPKKGKSYYDGDGLNKAQKDTGTFLAALNGSYTAKGPHRAYDGDTMRGQAVPGKSSQQQKYADAAEAEAQAKWAEENAYDSVFEAMPDMAKQDWAVNWWSDDKSEEFPVKQSWEPTQAEYDSFVEGLPEDYHQMWSWAKSPEHAAYLKGQAMASNEREMRLSTMGIPGIIARMGTSFLDPTMVPAILATEGAATPFIVAAKIGRAAKIAAYGSLAAASGAAYDVAQMQYNPTIDGWDVAASMGLGLVLGGGFGALAVKKATRQEAEQIMRLGQAQFDSAGAARNPLAPPSSISPDNPELDPAYAAFSKARFSAVGASGGSKSGTARGVSRLYGEEATGLVGHGQVGVSASERMTMLFRKNMARYQQTMLGAWGDYADDMKLGRWAKTYKGAEYRDFQKQIGELLENRDPAAWDLAHPSVRKGVETSREIYHDFAKLANNPGLYEGTVRRAVRGFENVLPDQYYMPKVADHDNITALISKYGAPALKKMVMGAILKKLPNLDGEIARRVANGYFDNLYGAGYGAGDKLHGAMRLQSPDSIREALQNIDQTLDGDVLDEIVMALTPRDRGKESSFAKQRTALDYNYVDPDTGVSMRDLFMKDNEMVLQRYMREMSGRIALAQARLVDDRTGEVVVDGITHRTEHEQLLEWIKGDYAKLRAENPNAKGIGNKYLIRDVNNMEYLYDAILGHTKHNSDEAWVSWMRRMRDLNFVRLMNRMGLAQAQEFPRIVNQLGLKAAFQNMPSLRALRQASRTADGKLMDTLGQELEAMTGLGTDTLFGAQRFRHMDDVEGEVFRPGVGAAIDAALNVGKSFTNVASGMKYVNTYLQQMTMRGIAQKMGNLARGKKLLGLKGKDPERLRLLGWDDETATAIFRQYNDHVVFDGNKVKSLNLEAWDPTARARFEEGLFRWTRKIIQENDPGNMARWMTHPVSQLIFQFRTFVFGAWEKSTLHAVHHRDPRAFIGAMGEIVFGAATYMANTAANSVGREDQEEYLREKFQLQNLLLSGIGRSSIASIAPMLMDTGLAMGGIDPLFSYRTTGVASGGFTQNPTLGFMDSLEKGISGAVKSTIDGRPMSQSEIKGLTSILPNWWPVTAGIGAMIQDRDYLPPRN